MEVIFNKYYKINNVFSYDGNIFFFNKISFNFQKREREKNQRSCVVFRKKEVLILINCMDLGRLKNFCSLF